MWSALFWCGDLTFTGVPVPAVGEKFSTTTTNGNHGTSDEEQQEGSNIGYVGHCVRGFLSDITNGGQSGAQHSQAMIHNSKQKGAFTDTTSVSAMYLPHTNVFEGTMHKNTDNHVFRFWDSGLLSSNSSDIPFQGWEVHDEGLETSTSSWSAIGQFDIISSVQASELLTMTTLNFTKEEFKNLYGRLHSINNRKNKDKDQDNNNDNDDKYDDESTTTTSTTNTGKQSTFSSSAAAGTTVTASYWGNFVSIDIFLLALLVISL